MDQTLQNLFSSPARTAVLEILSKAEAPLHLRAIAEISGFNVNAINWAVRAMLKEKLIRPSRNPHFKLFRLNDERVEAKLLQDIVKQADSYALLREDELFSERVKSVLSFSDLAWLSSLKGRARSKPAAPAQKIFERIVSTLRAYEIPFMVSGELPISIYRLDRRAINRVHFEIYDEVRLPEALSSLKKRFPKSLHPEDSNSSFIRADREVVSIDYSFSKKASPALCQKFPFNDSLINFIRAEDAIISCLEEYARNELAFAALDDAQNMINAPLELDLAYLIPRIAPICPLSEIEVPKRVAALVRQMKRYTLQ